MSLGFSVEALLPAARVSGPLRMRLVRLEEDQWLDPAPDLAARKAGFDAHPQSVMVLPEAEAGIAELAELLEQRTGNLSPSPLTLSLSKGVEPSAAPASPSAGCLQQPLRTGFDKLRTSGGGVNFVRDGRDGLETCARSVWEDLCVMVQDAPGEPFRLGAAAVAFPTDWRLAEKIGRPLHQVHEPIHGYAEQLSSGVDKFMDGLQSFNIFGRTNAFVVASDDLRYTPQMPPAERFAHVTADNAGETLFVRCEREALRRLPKSRAIVFTIGIYRSPLGQLSDAAVARIAQSLDGLGDGELERRAGPHYAAALAGYAAHRARGLAA